MSTFVAKNSPITKKLIFNLFYDIGITQVPKNNNLERNNNLLPFNFGIIINAITIFVFLFSIIYKSCRYFNANIKRMD